MAALPTSYPARRTKSRPALQLVEAIDDRNRRLGHPTQPRMAAIISMPLRDERIGPAPVAFVPAVPREVEITPRPVLDWELAEPRTAPRVDVCRVPSRRAHRRPMRLRRMLPGVLTMALILGAWFGADGLRSSTPKLQTIPGETAVHGGYSYVVRPGDTLWAIATRLDPGGDPRALMDQLTAQLHGGTLAVGQRLLLP